MRKLLYTVALFVMASACSTKPESKPYNWEDDLYQRLLTDFCMTESQVKDYIRKYIPDVTDEQMRQWEASKALECMMLDGEKRYFRNAGPNLFRVDSTCYDIKIAKEGTSPSGSEKVNMENLPEIISAVKKEGKAIVAPKRMRVTYTLTVDTNAVPAGKITPLLVTLSPSGPGPAAGCQVHFGQRTAIHLFVARVPSQYIVHGETCCRRRTDRILRNL